MRKKTIKLIAEKYNRYKNIVNADFAKVYIQNNSIFFESNGKPYKISIKYKGTIRVSTNKNLFFRLDYARNIIKFTNLFGKEIPYKLFSFSGECIIQSCEVINYSGTSFMADRVENKITDKINFSNTNVEDENLILFEIPKPPKMNKTRIRTRGGYEKPRLNSNFYSNGTFMIPEKVDSEQLQVMDRAEVVSVGNSLSSNVWKEEGISSVVSDKTKINEIQNLQADFFDTNILESLSVLSTNFTIRKK